MYDGRDGMTCSDGVDAGGGVAHGSTCTLIALCVAAGTCKYHHNVTTIVAMSASATTAI